MKLSARLFLLTLLALSSFLPLCPEMSRAEASLGSGCFVQYTPFYDKLLSAGVFDVVTVDPAGRHPESMQLLFLKARLIHYHWDKTRTEQWQSADETSRLFSGDCADKAIWLYTHLRRNGYADTALVIGRYSPSSQVLHMWVTYVDPSGDTLLLDPTIQRKPWKADAFPKKFYKPLYILSGSDCTNLSQT